MHGKYVSLTYLNLIKAILQRDVKKDKANIIDLKYTLSKTEGTK